MHLRVKKCSNVDAHFVLKLVQVFTEQDSEQHVYKSAGESDVPVVFTVERTRDGRSFVTRTVKVLQRNKPIFVAVASFHIEEQGLEVFIFTSSDSLCCQCILWSVLVSPP